MKMFRDVNGEALKNLAYRISKERKMGPSGYVKSPCPRTLALPLFLSFSRNPKRSEKYENTIPE